MIYSADISTPKNTSRGSPKRTVLKITKGLVYRVEFEFPRGHGGLSWLCVYDGGSPVWPSNLGEWFRASHVPIAFDDTYFKTIEPFEFDIYTANDDDTYSHGALVRIGLVSKEIFMARFLPSYTYKYFLEMLETMRAEEEARRREIIESPFPWIK